MPLNGKTVILDTNGTWTYAPAAPAPAAAACADGRLVDSKKLPMTVCLPSDWKIDTTASGSFEIQAIQTSTDTYFGLVTERTIMSAANLRTAILYNASSATGVREEDIPILSETKEQIGGKEWDLIVYDVDFKGNKFRFGNYYRSLGELGAVQAVFWCSTPYFDQVKADIGKLASGISFTRDVP